MCKPPQKQDFKSREIVFKFKHLKMKRKKSTPHQIASILKVFDLGKSVSEINREHGISQTAFCKCCQRIGGMETSAFLLLNLMKKVLQYI